MEDFAQSREPDDLFSDEIEPTGDQAYGSTSTALPLTSRPAPPKSHSHNRQGPQSLNQSQRGGRRGGQHAAASSTRADQKIQDEQSAPTAQAEAATSLPVTKSTINEEARITSVRGDRSATGPAKPTKKTEAELSELMKSMQLKNAAKTEAHARAEKDQASFLQREQQAAAKRLEERKAIREQDMERAKNRERKIKAQGVREWDSEKQESDIVDRSRGGSSMYTRGAHGGVSGNGRGSSSSDLAPSRYGSGPSGGTEDAPYGDRGSRGRGRGRSDYRGGRGSGLRGDRGGRGRGGYFNGAISDNAPPVTLADLEFPALPMPSAKRVPAPNQKVKTTDSQTIPPGIGKGDWAEEMATPIEKT